MLKEAILGVIVMELFVIFGLCIVELDFYLKRKKMQKNPIKLVSLKSISILAYIDKKAKAVRKRNEFYNRRNIKRCINFKERKIKKIRRKL
ncbi:hypothetical protein [Cetobacterium sp.]|uniref:hypothetical protein n=1 Tax=Cetobacterium sp. TaxID=2071632 RepID=UPI003F37E842